MALAEQEDVEARLGRALTVAEEARLLALLSDASDLVIGWTGQDFMPAPFPDAVVGVTASMVARVFAAADVVTPHLEQRTAGPFTNRYSAAATSGDVWLSAADKIKLKRHRRGGGLTSVQTVGERYEITEDEA